MAGERGGEKRGTLPERRQHELTERMIAKTTNVERTALEQIEEARASQRATMAATRGRLTA